MFYFGPNCVTDLVTCRKNRLVGRDVKIIVKLITDKDRQRERKVTFQIKISKQAIYC